MEHFKSISAGAYDKQFKLWDAALKKSGSKTLEDLYKKAHAQIRKSPAHTKAVNKNKDKKAKVTKKLGYILVEDANKKKWLRHKRLTREERLKRVQNKIAA